MSVRVTVEGFTRQEAVVLTGCDSNRLDYLERLGLIIPTRIGFSKKPIVLYTWEQLIQIRVIQHLRKEISSKTIKKIIAFLDQYDIDAFKNKNLVVFEDNLFWVNADFSDIGQIQDFLKDSTSKHQGKVRQHTLLIVPPLYSVASELWSFARQSSLIDFESFRLRAKAIKA